MPGRVKTLDSMDKHLTKGEIEAREQAEAAVIPDRAKARLEPPAHLKGKAADKRAVRYWKSILKRMEGLAILDDLDAETLGIYCSMLSRRDATQEVFNAALDESLHLEGDKRVEALGKLGDLQVKLQALEKTILSYADKLGLTPSGRVSLARKRATAADQTPADDLFGD